MNTTKQQEFEDNFSLTKLKEFIQVSVGLENELDASFKAGKLLKVITMIGDTG